MSMVLRWRVPARRVTLRWRGPAGLAESLRREPVQPLAAVVGPPGPQGPAGLQGPAGSQGPFGAPLRVDAPLAATWVLPHPLGRVPGVQVFLNGGEAVLADVDADAARITVTFASPRQGFVLLV